MEESFDKPSFLIYKHDFNSISYFSDELLGLLFRTICEYQNDKKARIDVDPRIMQAFQFFKTQFDYDDKKYMKRVIANRSNRKKTQRIKKKDWKQIKSTPLESNEIVCNHWNQWRPI